jgi:hypothetical protein
MDVGVADAAIEHVQQNVVRAHDPSLDLDLPDRAGGARRAEGSDRERAGGNGCLRLLRLSLAHHAQCRWRGCEACGCHQDLTPVR